MVTKGNINRRQQIKKHIRKTVRGTTGRPRIVVFRSIKHLYVQVVDDLQMKTITSASTLSPDVKTAIQEAKDKKAIAKQVGIAIAKKAVEQNIKKVVFDRNGYLYHGVIKALADGAREGGLEF